MSSASSSSGSEREETWDDWTEEDQSAQSLFDQQSFPSAKLALEHDKQTHGVDLALLATTLGQSPLSSYRGRGRS